MNPGSSPAWETVRDSLDNPGSLRIEVLPFVFDSPTVTRSSELADYALASFTPSRPVLEALLDLTARIHSDFEFDPTPTHAGTRTIEAFRIRRGVCQDFAHVGVGCLRSIGLAARYVSGYLRTLPPKGQPRLAGADESHAWFSLYCGDLGWVDVDATNNMIPSTDHITIAWGRDYSDVCPIRGVYIGGRGRCDACLGRRDCILIAVPHVMVRSPDRTIRCCRAVS